LERQEDYLVASVDQIRALRNQTGAGIMDCKVALEQTQGDMEKAAEVLREQGFAQAAKRSDRETNQGAVQAYIHTGSRVGAIVELGCETDFVARTPEFQALAHDIAMQVAAMAPAYLDEGDKEADDDRPAAQVCLLKQPFIKGGSSVAEIVQEMAAKVGENVRVVRFSRLALGE
jgi:elongation factor Ts